MTDSNPKITTVSLGSLSKSKEYTRQSMPLASTMGKAEYESDQPLWELLGAASDPQSSSEALKEILSGEDAEAIELAIYNPSLPISDAADYLRQKSASLRVKRSNFFRDLSKDEFAEHFDFGQWDMDSEQLEDFEALLAVMQGQDVDAYTYEFEDEVEEFIFDVYIIVTQGRDDQRKLLKQLHPDFFQFIENLVSANLIEPFIFWTSNAFGFDLTREKMLGEHDGQVLIAEGNLFDMGAVGFIDFPEEFKPLEDIDEGWIYNVESGLSGVSSELLPADLNVEHSSDQKFEVLAGEGDGYYPTIPFFDAFGQLQIITTFFIPMAYSSVLDDHLTDPGFTGRSTIFENRIPIKLGYLKSNGSLLFGDSYGLYVDATSTYDILEFVDVPKETYLVVAYMDTEERTWALSLMRDRAKRNYEILFEIFPELVRTA